MEGTITLRNKPAPLSPLPIIKPSAKKTDVIEVTVHLDGDTKFVFSYRVPMSAQLMSGQKSEEYMKQLFAQLLSKQFGKAMYDAT